MKMIAIVGLLLVSTASSAVEKPKTPKDVAALTRRVEICTHLAGEFGSEDPVRAQELADSWDKNRCDDRFLGKDIKSLRKKYAQRPKTLAPLDAMLRRARVEFGIDF